MPLDTMQTTLLLILFLGTFGALAVNTSPESEYHIRWTFRNYPNPRTDHRVCGRYDASWICDPNSLILENEANNINSLLKSVYEETRCTCYKCPEERIGYPIMVALMPELHRIFNASNSLQDLLLDTKIFSYLLSQRFKFGDCEDALVVIVYVKNFGVVYTLTRPNARSKLTDELVAEVAVDTWDYFQDGDKKKVAMGLKQMIQDYKNIFLDQYERRTPIPPRSSRTRYRSDSGSSVHASGLLIALFFMIPGLYSKRF